MRYWLMKSEPDVYSFDDLLRDKKTHWEGVRNYTARNFMRDDMKKGDVVLYYHSNAKPPHIAGIAEIEREGYPDPSQFNPKSDYYDATAKPDEPRWVLVDVKPVRKLARAVTLDELKANKKLASMGVVQKGQRLSVMPVTKAEFDEVVAMEKRPST
jgi:predicted RNA-binding protein with PUA-like domain